MQVSANVSLKTKNYLLKLILFFKKEI